MTPTADYTVSSKPLFDWFARDKNNRATLRSVGYTDGRITNWKRRGIPIREVGRIAPFMGLTYEQYVALAVASSRKPGGWRPEAPLVMAILTLFLGLLSPDVKAISHNYSSSEHFSAKSLYGIHILGLLRRIMYRLAELFRLGQFAVV